MWHFNSRHRGGLILKGVLDLSLLAVFAVEMLLQVLPSCCPDRCFRWSGMTVSVFAHDDLPAG